MPEYIGINNVARNVTQQYIGVSSVSRQVVNGYIGVGGVARLFFGGSAKAVTNFKKTSKGYNYIYFSWTNPTSNYTGIIIRAQTGSYPTSLSQGTQVYKGVGTNTTSGGTNTSGKVSLSISSRTSTTYYFSVWSYYVIGGAEVYSSSPIQVNAALVCYNCSPTSCNDCCDGDCNSVCSANKYWCNCQEIDRCSPWCSAESDCGSVWFECTEGWDSTCSECGTCSDCVNYPACGNETY